MTYIILILTILTCVFFVFSYKNRYAFFLALMVVAIIGILYSTLNMIYKTGYYTYATEFWGRIDYSIFLFLVRPSLGYNRIIQINNISVSVYMFSAISFAFLYFQKVFVHSDKKIIMRLATVGIFPLYYSWFYDPKTTYKMYIVINGSGGRIFKNLIFGLDMLNYITAFFYAVLPLIFVYMSIRKSKTYLHKKLAVTAASCLVVVDIFFMLVLCIGFFRKPFIFDSGNLLAVTRLNNTLGSEIYILISFVSVLLVGFTLYIINKFSMTAKLGIVKQYVFRHNLNELSKNYISVFHSVKNIIFSYKILLEKARTQNGDEKEQTLSELENKIDGYINRISFMLDVENNNLETEFEDTTLSHLVNKCLAQFNGNGDIEFVKVFNPEKITVNIDLFYMTDALINIIQNAVDAINKKGSLPGKITFEGSIDGEWAVLKISDTGVGMNKKEISNLFKPFYTTKSRITNWGVGLSFSYRIIRFHGGYITVESTPGAGTSFYIYLPKLSETGIRYGLKFKYRKEKP